MKRDYIDTMRSHWQEQVREDEVGEEHLATQLKLYIPTSLSTAESVTVEQRKDASSEVQAFLQGDKRVLLLLGDSGAGKSLFGQWLVNDSWQHLGPDTRIPLFIHLPAQNIKTFSLENHLIKQYNFTDIDIADLKANNRFLLILDAYDEMKIKHRGKNLYRIGKLYKWDVKVIISCRTEALVSFDPIEQRLMFQPCDNFEEPLPLAWEKRYVQFFDPNTDLPQYIERWKRHNREHARPDLDYLQVLTTLPGLLKMIENPFILWIVMMALPDLLVKYADKPLLERYHETRLELFNTFTILWFKRQRDKLLKNNLISDTFRESILEDYRCYCEQLANLMWQKKINSITYDPMQNPVHGMLAVENLGQLQNLNDETLAAFFAKDGHFMGDSEKPLLAYIRQGALLRIIDGKTYEFLHHSLLEYFSAERLFKSAANKATIAMGLEINTQLITNDAARIRFGVDCIRTDPVFEQALWDIIEESKTEPRVEKASANAITILVAANRSFAGKDLRRICIRYANLSEGNFEGADLREADLRDVNLCSTNLVGANLSGCCFDRIDIDGFAHEEMDGTVIACAFSTDGNYYAVLTKKRLNLYESTTHKKLFIPEIVALPKGTYQTKYKEDLCAFAFLPNTDSLLLASDSNLLLISIPRAKVIRRWLAHDFPIYVDYHGSVKDNGPILNLFISFDGCLALTVARIVDRTDGKFSLLKEFKHWDCATWRCISTWRDNKDFINEVVLSPNGKWCLSVDSIQPSIKKWDCSTGKCVSIWKDEDYIKSLAISRDGLWALSGSNKGTIKRWDCATGDCLATWQANTGGILKLALSSDGSWALSLATSGSFKCWDSVTGTSISISGAAKLDPMSTFALSSGDCWVLSCRRELNNSILSRWDLMLSNNLKKNQRLGHKNTISAMALSLNGCTVLTYSCELDSRGVIKSWDCDTGDCLATWSQRHVGYVRAMGISPNGSWAIVGAKGKSIELHDCFRGQYRSTWQRYQIKVDPYESINNIFHPSDSINKLKIIDGCELNKSIDAFALSPDGRWAFSGASDGEIKRWNCSTGECEFAWGLSEHNVNRLSALVLNFNAGWLLVAGDVIKRLDYTTGEWNLWELPISLSKAGYIIKTLTLSANGRMALSGDSFGGIILWDCATERCLKTWQAYKSKSAVEALTFSPDGLWAASCDNKGVVIIWQLSDGDGRRLSMGATTLCWSLKDPTLLIMGFRDGSVKSYTFEADTRLLSLRWRSSTDNVQIKNCQMLNVHGLSEIQQLFFSQQGAKLHASTKPSAEIIEQRRQRVPDVYGSPRRSLFDKTYLIFLSHWIVTVARRKTGAGAQHAFLILESVEQPSSAEPICYRIRRIDFLLELRHFALPEGAKKPEKTDAFGQGLIEIADKTIDEATYLAENCYHRSAQISAVEGRQLLQAISEDQQQRLAYSKPGSGDLYLMFRMPEAVKHYNCLSWIRKHLEAIDVDIVKKHFADFFVESPAAKLNSGC